MASFLLTAAKPLLLSAHSKPLSPLINTAPPSHRTLGVRRRNSLRVSAMVQKWEPSKVVPQADRVLIRLEELPEKSAGGVLLPKSAVKFERYLMGEILSVGADVGDLEAGKKRRKRRPVGPKGDVAKMTIELVSMKEVDCHFPSTTAVILRVQRREDDNKKLESD